MKTIFTKSSIQVITPVPLEVVKYSHAAVGGPKKAELRGSGSLQDCLKLLDWIGAKASIYNDTSTPRWWGYVGRVEVEYDKVKIISDLENMYNRVAVAYTETVLGDATTGERHTTDWAEDSDSIRAYGRKELLLSISDTTATAAEQARDRALAAAKVPTAGFEPSRTLLPPGRATVVMILRGWWDTLEWRYAPVATELALAFETIGTVTQTFGDNTTEQIAQAFDVASAINVQSIGVYIYKSGAPADNVRVSIYDNPDDLTPTNELAYQTVAASSLGTTGAWVTLTLSSAYATTAGISYFLVLSRSGAQDASNYYVTVLDSAEGYGAGPFVRYDGANWAAYAADMPFRLYDNALIANEQQVKSLIANYGQFLGEVNAEDATGVTSESYRDGDTTARYEVELLMETGTTNDRRLLASVDQSQRVRLYEQSASTNRTYGMDTGGRFYDPEGNPVMLEECISGVWVQPRNIFDGVMLTSISGVQAFFIEEAEYNTRTGELSYRASNIPDARDLGVRYG